MSAHGGRNLRVNKKYTRQESNLRLGLACIQWKKKRKSPNAQHGNAHSKTKNTPSRNRTCDSGYCASVREK